jgi:hypothetical protein
MKLKSVRGKNNVQRAYREYEIDTGAIEALNSVEKRAAIETGQEQENVNLTGQIGSKSIALIEQSDVDSGVGKRPRRRCWPRWRRSGRGK